MPHWDAGVWVGIVGVVIGIVAVGVAAVAWLRPRAPRPAAPQPHQTLRVTMTHAYPTWETDDHPLSHLFQVTLRNGTEQRVKVDGWGLLTPDGQQIVVPIPATAWEPLLPHWIEPGDAASWFVSADKIEARLPALGTTSDELLAYVRLADGRTITAKAKGFGS